MQFQGFDWFTELPCENFSEISARFWPPRFSSRRDLATNLGAFLAAEIFISPRSRPRSRRDLGTNVGAFLAAEIIGEISGAKNRRD